MNTDGRNRELELLQRLLRTEAAAVALEAEQARVRQLRDAAQAAAQQHRVVVAELDQKLHVARAELYRLQASVSFRLGVALVSAVRSPRGWLRVPGTIARLLRERGRVAGSPAAVAAAAGSASAPAPAFEPLPIEPLPGPAPNAVELRLVPPPPPIPGTLAELRVAAILDPFSVASFAPECRLLELSPAGWAGQIKAFRPHLLLVESAWLGRDEEWRGLVERGGDELRSLVASCRRAGIPCVFWNKEDPLHFEAFLESAQLFDHVFTTDAGCLTRYRGELGHDRVHLLPFALQPRTHHPVAGTPRTEAAFFAGAWYGNMDQRSADFRTVADAVGLALPLDIYDRNSDAGDVTRRFPAKYAASVRPSVAFADTPDLYRSYRIGLNLNTIKTSPTMFARRVFELIGCNTSVYGNHSRGLRLLLGDLTVASDDGEELLRAAYEESREPHALRYRRRRLLALRKVLEQHTWSHRLQRIARQVFGEAPEVADAPLVMIARADDAAALRVVLAAARRQRGVAARLAVQVPPALRHLVPDDVESIGADAGGQPVAERFAGEWVAPIHPADHYGPDYLRDLALGRAYSRGDVLGKAAYHHFAGDVPTLVDADLEYRRVDALALRRSLLPASRWQGSVAALLQAIPAGSLTGDDLVSLDVFSYCEAGAGHPAAEPGIGDPDPDPGLDLVVVDAAAERLPVPPSITSVGPGGISGRVLSRAFNRGVIPRNVSACARRERLEICSLLPPGREDALFSIPLQREAIERNGEVIATLAGSAGAGLSFYLDALDAHGTKIARVGLAPLAPARLTPPAGTAGYRFAAMVRGRQLRHLDGVWLDEGHAEPLLMPGEGRLLVVTNTYPEAGNLYRNAFLHRRVLEYRQRGIGVDVVVVTPRQPQLRSYEFDGVPVVCCGPETLRATLAASGHAAIAVHFLDAAIWPALADAARHTRTVVWLHGAEIQPWTRRPFNQRTDKEREEAIAASDARMDFWRGLLADPPAGLHLAFVSRSFAEDCWQDLGLRLPDDRWRVIHNPIDTSLFSFVEKPAEQRLRILSIRPHGYRVYANDLVAATIRELAGHPQFPRMSFRLIGDGALFEENFAGLDAFPNVRIERRFLRQKEIAELHRDYGVFLIPTRSDTQGVSRDEAMASGLVPVTNDVGAVSEFVDGRCGVLAPAEDVQAMAAGLLALAERPERFLAMSRAAAARVRFQSDVSLVVDREVDWLGVRASPRHPPDC